MSEAREATKPWAVRDFRLLLVGFAASRAGHTLYSVALIVTVLERTGSAAWVSASIVARIIPPILIGPLGGVIADRYDRRRVIIVADLSRVALLCVMAVVVILGGPVIALVVLAGLVSTAGVPSFPAVAGLLPDVVDEDALPAANSAISSVEYLALIIGPALGAVLLVAGSASTAFFIDACTFVVSAFCMSLIAPKKRPVPHTPSPPEGGAQDDDTGDERPGVIAGLREGVVILGEAKAVRALVAVLAVTMLVFGFEQIYAPLVSSELLGTGESGLGWLDAAVGVGGVLGAALAARLAASKRPRGVLAFVLLGSTLPMASLALISVPWVAYLVLGVEGAAAVAIDVVALTTVQRVAPREAISRVDSLIASLALTSMLVGNLAAPLLLRLVGLRWALVLAALVPTIPALIALTRARLVDEMSAEAVDETAVQLALLRPLSLVDGMGSVGLERLAQTMTREAVDAGAAVVTQGALADDLFILAEGEVDILVTSSKGEVLVNHLTAPDFFGEIGVVHQRPRIASVVTTTPCILWRISGEVFLEASTGSSTTSPALSSVLGRRMAVSAAAAQS